MIHLAFLALFILLVSANDAAAVTNTITKAPVLPTNAPQFVTESLFQSAILNSTNTFRHEHNAPSATWNDTLAAFATDYLANNSNCAFEHSGGPYGENLAIGCSDASGCVDVWGRERRSYNFANPGFTHETGHFSQLVWKNSTTVGCGRRLCTPQNSTKYTGWYLVCEYWPRGNVQGQYSSQVSRQVRGPPDDDDAFVGERPSSGLIMASVVVLLITITAVVGDMVSVLRDRTR